jgi:hypothetical protein
MIDVGLLNLSGFDPAGVMINVGLSNLSGFDPAGVMFEGWTFKSKGI